MRPCWVVRPYFGQLCPFPGFHIKKHEMLRIRKSGNVVVILRKAGIPLAFRTRQGCELVGLQIQLVDGVPRNSLPVAKNQRIAIPRPVGIKLGVFAFGHFFGGSTIRRYDMNVHGFARHGGSECNLFPIR